MRTKNFLLLAFALFFAGADSFASPDPPPEQGQTIFRSRCASCHNVNKLVVGPALAGIDTRRSMEWIANFVRSSQTMVKNGDKDAIALYEKFNKVPMPDHPDLTDDNIKSILEYIKAESQSIEKANPAKVVQRERNYFPLSLTKNYGLIIAFLASVALLIWTLLFAAKVNKLAKKPAAMETIKAS
jgi:mono/diheme cytochrome c family protein